MLISWKQMTRRMALGLYALALILLLAACSTSGSAITSTPTPTPTPRPPTPTPTPVVPMKTYTGPNFSISYPTTWQESASGNQVSFADIVSKNIMTVVIVPNPGGTLQASAVVESTLPVLEKSLLTNSQPVTIAPTATVGGESWAQTSATGNLAVTDPGTQGTMVVLGANHPAAAANTQTYVIAYYGPSTTFSQSNTMDFQPMLQSFKFAG